MVKLLTPPLHADLCGCFYHSQPYRHLDFPLGATSHPLRQRGSAQILHSYLDPPPPLTKPNATPYSSDTLPPFPNVLPSLAPGRRGAWIIPLSGPLPWKAGSPAPPIWLSPAQQQAKAALLAVPTQHLLPSSSPAPAADLNAPSSRSGTPTPRSSSRRIEWTPARLRCTWFWLTRLHLTGKHGPVSAAAFSAEEVRGTGMPDHIRVYAAANLALSLRQLLKLFDVASARMEGEAEEDRKDRVRFLERVGLVWVDEAGRPVLVA